MRQRSGAPLNPPELISLRKTGQAMVSDFGNPDEQAGNEYAERSQSGGSGRKSKRATLEVIWRAESAGIEFIDENGGGPGVRLRKRQAKKS
jgi:hypothetical protein